MTEESMDDRVRIVMDMRESFTRERNLAGERDEVHRFALGRAKRTFGPRVV